MVFFFLVLFVDLHNYQVSCTSSKAAEKTMVIFYCLMKYYHLIKSFVFCFTFFQELDGKNYQVTFIISCRKKYNIIFSILYLLSGTGQKNQKNWKRHSKELSSNVYYSMELYHVISSIYCSLPYLRNSTKKLERWRPSIKRIRRITK